MDLPLYGDDDDFLCYICYYYDYHDEFRHVNDDYHHVDFRPFYDDYHHGCDDHNHDDFARVYYLHNLHHLLHCDFFDLYHNHFQYWIVDLM